MFSQYSWGDYFKFMALIGAIYYAFVLIRYYREDIREWISNRGNSNERKAQPVEESEEEEEVDSANLYSTKQYTSSKAPVQNNQAPAATTASWSAPADDIDLSGETVDEHSGNGFQLPLAVEAVRPNEQSVAELQEAASRTETDEQGTVRPTDPKDKAAERLARIINDQQGNQAFSGISFNR
ncbi:hypothetical protein GCM10028818_55490 [Spirosoma horti]